MKKVFMPTMDELYEMQDKGANIKFYLYAKAIESLCMDYANYPCKGIFKTAYKYLCEDPVIAHAVCMMYPEEIKYSEISKFDIDLAYKLISDDKDKNSIYKLDNLSYFSYSVTDSDNIVKMAVNILAREIANNPKYRFEYKDSTLLDNIFMGTLDYEALFFSSRDDSKKKFIESLSSIEPFYAYKEKDYALLNRKITDYINRYGFNYPYGMGVNYGMGIEKEDILTNQTVEVKRLIKCINERR